MAPTQLGGLMSMGTQLGMVTSMGTTRLGATLEPQDCMQVGIYSKNGLAMVAPPSNALEAALALAL